MTLDEIEHLMRLVRQQGLSELVHQGRDTRIALRAATSAAPIADPAPPQPEAAQVVRASHFGLFRAVHPGRTEPEATIGQQVTAGQILAFIEAGRLLHPVVAETPGTLGECLVADGALVGYGAPVFALD
ncbi:Biotin carboxyl carrier protein of acetyl-CoA carboxylase [Rhodovulum sp. P5]|uniref:acetyl-CoA carboxylase biotin carboxyl carrier protein n=1 Tax=Rhodovulum sp. P5 TaxID=1564506 RepID=UPI0009C1D84A|nr:acetyl-CoA carboxylase biotin carboxyl carrier protein subunit [Rhodovulum sp. P5]ARE40714.1 Biotin carboxyl carrier protein of acetyl-CoA carboxylase [Rhodovulum sp. P5]